MGVLANLGLLTVGITVAATLVLGTSVYFANRTSLTNRMFLGFSVVTAFWGIINFFSYQFSNPVLTIWLLRGILFFAVFQAFFLYEFFSVFPERNRIFLARHNFILVPVVFSTAILTLTPYVFSGIVGTVVVGQVAVVQKGPGLILFGIVAISLVVRALFIFLKKLRNTKNEEHQAIITVLVGTVITFSLIIFFNLILATIFVNPRYVPLGALFMFPFVAFASYAVVRQHFFNIKIVSTSALVFILSIVSFGEIIFSDTLPLILFRTSVFVLVLAFGINLIRGVLREVEQREKIQKLADELEETNERQKGLIRFISHEVKGFLTKDASVFAALVEGDFGALPEEMKPIVNQALAQSRDGVRSAEDILKASNQKKGTTEYKKESFDLKTLAEEAVEKSRMLAEGKKLALSFTAEDAGAPYTIVGDRNEIGDHVLRNLIDNSINYTPTGSIAVSLKKENGKIVFSVKDTGIGITEEDKKHLFTEGGHGKDSQKVNVHSTGYGLYIAKNIVTAHGGAIRAESEGEGKGSTFVVELPA